MKNKLFIISIFSLVLLTGCSNNSLKCTLKNDTINSKYTFIFDDENKLSELKMNEKNLYQQYDALIELDYLQLVDKYATLDNIDGVKYDIKENKNDITKKLEVEFSKYDKKNNLIEFSSNNTKEELKAEFENKGYTCK